MLTALFKRRPAFALFRFMVPSAICFCLGIYGVFGLLKPYAESIRHAAVVMMVNGSPLLLAIAFILSMVAYRRLAQSRSAQRHAEIATTALEELELQRHPEAAFAQVGVPAITLSFGDALASLYFTDSTRDETLAYVTALRHEFARSIGVVIPGIALQDDSRLPPNGYAVYIRGELQFSAKVEVEAQLAMGSAEILEQLDGRVTRDPVTGHMAKWIYQVQAERARTVGALVYDPFAVIISNLGKILRENAAELVHHQEYHALLAHLGRKAPALIKELESEVLPPALAYRTYKALLREGIWPVDPIYLFEAMLEEAQTFKAQYLWLSRSQSWDKKVSDYEAIIDIVENPVTFAEALRKKLVPRQLRKNGAKQMLKHITVGEDLRRRILSGWNNPLASFGQVSLCTEVKNKLHLASMRGMFVLTKPDERVIVRDYLAYIGVAISVLATDEIPATFLLRQYAVVSENEFRTVNIEQLPAFPL